MTETKKDQRIVQLEAENAGLRTLITQLTERIAELEARLGKDSHNSSKPPSSDGYGRRRQTRPATGKKPGGQPGHAGRTLERQVTADQVVTYRPPVCAHCQTLLEGIPATRTQVRQVLDLPPVRLDATDHVVETICCPNCGQLSQGSFPEQVTAPVQYGPQVQALAVYLNEGQLLPSARTVEVLTDLLGAPLSEGTLETWVQQASAALIPFEQHATQALASGDVLHGDETGVRIGNKLHWMHVASTACLTLLGWHAKRGHAAVDAMQVWPQFAGIAVHDRWATYWRYSCAHALCHAHLQRELTALAEQGEEWAAHMQDVLRSWYDEVAHARTLGQPIDPWRQQQWWRRYWAILNGGFAAHPPTPIPKRRGRPKQSPAKNLLDAFLAHADAVLAFIGDPRVPLTNNQAERDLRLVKVQQKISGCFRSEVGATAFCRIRSYLGTARKQGVRILDALTHALQGAPLPLACLPE